MDAASSKDAPPTTTHDAERAQEDIHARKRLLRKVDFHVLPIVTLMYLMSGLDRSNIGNAKIAGLTDDLRLSPSQYAVAASMIYASYVTGEIPSNLLLKKFTPRRWLPFLCLSWGLVTVGTGFVKSYPSLVVVRLILGFAESGLMPGLTFLLTLWYPRHYIILRFGMFYSAGGLAGAFGGLLARGLVEMDGIGGLEGWRWIFIIEGLITVLIALIAFRVLANGPSQARFLSTSEKNSLVSWLHADSAGESHDFQWREVRKAFRMPVVWTAALLCVTVALPSFSFALFIPSIIHSMGYSATTSQLLTVPPYAVGFVTTIIATYWSDRLRHRTCFVLGAIATSMVGYIMLIGAQSTAVRYTGCFFVTAGAYPATAINVPWLSNNLRGHSRRAVGAAVQLAVGQFGGVAGSFIYPDTTSPRFIMGHSIALGSLALAVLATMLQYVVLSRMNARLDAGEGFSDVQSSRSDDATLEKDKPLTAVSSTPSSLSPSPDKPPKLGYLPQGEESTEARRTQGATTTFRYTL